VADIAVRRGHVF